MKLADDIRSLDQTKQTTHVLIEDEKYCVLGGLMIKNGLDPNFDEPYKELSLIYSVSADMLGELADWNNIGKTFEELAQMVETWN